MEIVRSKPVEAAYVKPPEAEPASQTGPTSVRTK